MVIVQQILNTINVAVVESTRWRDILSSPNF